MNVAHGGSLALDLDALIRRYANRVPEDDGARAREAHAREVTATLAHEA